MAKKALFSKKLSCVSCGGEMVQHYAFSKSIVCPYCGISSHITPNGTVQKDTNKGVLVDYGSPFAVGMSLKLRNATNSVRNFQIIGRLRFEYEDGFWDEWMVLFEDTPEKVYWLEETEGRLTLMSSQEIISEIAPIFEKSKVGSVFPFKDKKIFIRAKSWAKVVGVEGESAFELSFGAKADFIDGILDGKNVAFEYLSGEVTFSAGEAIAVESLEIEA